MGLIVANKITLHGNQAVQDLEAQIRARFLFDSKKKKNRDTAIKRIFFGLDDDSEFDWVEKTGSHWGYFDDRESIPQLFFISGHPTLTKLAEHIAIHAAKLDPKVVVQLDYDDSDGVVIGTSLSAVAENTEPKTYHLNEYSPYAKNSGLSRSFMEKIKSAQRNAIRSQLLDELGSNYKYLKLTKTKLI
jgi:hypothetical protein